MTRAVRYPPGGWPLEMPSEMAAAYCGETSVESFKAKVALGIYSAPASTPHCRPKWHRFKLDADIARRHNLKVEIAHMIEDATDLIA